MYNVQAYWQLPYSIQCYAALVILIIAMYCTMFRCTGYNPTVYSVALYWSILSLSCTVQCSVVLAITLQYTVLYCIGGVVVVSIGGGGVPIPCVSTHRISDPRSGPAQLLPPHVKQRSHPHGVRPQIPDR